MAPNAKIFATMHLFVAWICTALPITAELRLQPPPCPLHTTHILTDLRSLPTHGKTAVSEANHACSGNWQCRAKPTCCEAALAYCGNTHVKEITHVDHFVTLPSVTLLPTRQLLETALKHIEYNAPVTSSMSSETQRQSDDPQPFETPHIPIDQLSYIASAALYHLNDVATNPNFMLIPSASSYKPRSGQRHMPVLEIWDDHSSTPRLLSTTDRWELKATFRSTKSSSNEDVLGLLIDIDLAHVLALRGMPQRYSSSHECLSRERRNDIPPCKEGVLQAIEAMWEEVAEPNSTLIITASDEGAKQAGEYLTELLAKSTHVHGLYFSNITDSGRQEGGPALCTLLCPSLDGSGKPRRLERQDGAEYIYVNLPGGLERSVWLAIVATLVLLGSWNGSYKMSTMTF